MNDNDKKQIAELRQQQQDIIEKGNGKSDIPPELSPVFSDPEVALRIVQAVEKSRNTNTEDSTKFTILRDLSDPSKLNYHTEFRDFKEIQQMNRGRIWIDLCRLVYTTNRKLYKKIVTDTEVKQSDGTVLIQHVTSYQEIIVTNEKRINQILSVYERHFDKHMENMVSYQRKRELSLVHALKNDDSVVKTDSAVRAFVGARK